MRVLVCGGRRYADYEKIKSALAELLEAGPVTLVIHGAAAGADALADRAANELGLPVQAVPADWDRHGKLAGSIRNQKMRDEYLPDIVLAFPSLKSRGTWDMIRRAKQTGIEVRISDAEDPVHD